MQFAADLVIILMLFCTALPLPSPFGGSHLPPNMGLTSETNTIEVFTSAEYELCVCGLKEL